VRDHRIAIAMAAVALCAWCGWVSGFHRTTPGAETSWACTAAAVLVFDVALWLGSQDGRIGLHVRPVPDPWPRPGRGGPRLALRGVAPWLALIAVVVAWEVLGIDTGPDQYHLTISALAQAYRPLNAALLLVWALVGVGYEAARVRAPAALRGVTDRRQGDAGTAPGSGTCAAFAATGSLGAHHGPTALLLPQSPGTGIAFWVAVPLAALLIDASARPSSGRRATAEEFVRFISTAWPANVALVAAWGFAGYHLFAR
jgi:hypothetical protein